MNDELLTIQEAAKYFGVSTRTLRRWEEKGLLKPHRTVGNQRRYSKSQLANVFKKPEAHTTFSENPKPFNSVIATPSTVIPATASAQRGEKAGIQSMDPRVPDFARATSRRGKPEDDREGGGLPRSFFARNDGDIQQQPLPLPNPHKKEPAMLMTLLGGMVSGLLVLMLVALLFTVTPGIGGAFTGLGAWLSSPKADTQQENIPTQGVLAAGDRTPLFELRVNVPSVFGQKVTFLDSAEIEGGLSVEGQSVLNGGIVTNNTDIDAGTGEIIASNIIYSIVAGSNVTVSGDPQNPTISADVAIPEAVASLQGQTGALSLTSGSGIGLNGLQITNAGVLSLQGATGAVSLTGGTGITVSGTTISNSDTGSAQNIFKTFTIDGTDITASSNDDTFTFAAGSGITLTGDAGDKKLTIASTASSGGLSGLTTSGVLYATSSTTATSTSPGTTGTVLKGVTSGVPVFGAVDLTADVTGVLPIANGGTGTATIPANGQLLIGNGTNYTVGNLTGTANQINISNGAGSIIFSTPQDIATSSTPTFGSLNLSSATNQLVLSAGNTGTVSLAALTVDRTYTLPDQSGTICLTSGNCSGTGGSISGSGTANYIAKFTSASGISDSSIFDDGTGVGIGTTSPTGLFSVEGANVGAALVSLNETGDQNILVGSASGTTRFVFDRSGNLNITGGSYQIGGSAVLDATTLGSVVVNSSLTSVGVLSTGSIASGFGNIDVGIDSITGGDITSTGSTGITVSGNEADLTFSGTGSHDISASAGTLRLGGATLTGTVLGNSQNITGLSNLSAGGTITFGALSAGIVKSDGSGVLSSGAVALGGSEVSGTLGVTNGGTGLASFTTGDLLFASGANTLAARDIGSNGQILTVSGGLPTWSNAGGTINFWQRNSGALAPLDISDDFLVGGAATSSALFRVSGTTGEVNVTGSIQTTGNQALTIGGNTTGNITLSPQNGSGTVTSTGDLTLASGKAYQINGTNVLTGTALGSGVTGSSLTSVGAVTVGSIASGFGTISTGNSITGTTINGTSGISTGGTPRIDNAGNLTNIGTTQLNSVTYTWPGADGSNEYVLTTDGSGGLVWMSVTGIGGAGDITAIGDVTSGAAFTSTGTQGTSLYFYDAQGRGQLTIADLSQARTYTLPNEDGTVCLTSGNCSGVGGGLAGSGTAGQIGYFSASNTLTSEGSGFAWNATNDRLGIGNDNPTGKLDVTGANVGKALAIFNETGNQDILTASASGTTRLVLTNGGNLNIIGGSYQIGGTNVLSSTTLGSGVTSSSLTTVGSLGNGSITSGFGAIDIGTDNLTAGGTITFGGLSSGVVRSNGSGVLSIGDVVLGTETTGNYVATLTSGNGVSASATGEGSTPTIDLGALTADWNQTSAFDISLNNASSELRILESAGATFYGTLDAGDLAADKTYVLPNFTGSTADICLTSGNCAGVGGGITGSGASGQVAYFDGTSSVTSEAAFAYNATTDVLDIAGAITAGTADVFTISAAGAISTLVNETINGVDISSGTVSDVVNLTINTSGDLTIGSIGLNDVGTSNITSGGSLVGVFDEFTNSNSNTVQDVLDDLDSAMGAGGAKLTDGGTFTYLTDTTDSLTLGSSSLELGKLGVAGDADEIQLVVRGNATQTNNLAVFENSAGTDQFTIANNGNVAITSLANCDSIDTNASGLLACGTDAGSGTAGVVNIENNDTGVGTGIDTIDFSTDFLVGNNPADEVNISIADDALNFTEFSDTLALDASTSITTDGTEVLSLVNTGTGNSFLVEDVASDTSPFVITAAGNVGVGTTTPASGNKLHVEGQCVAKGTRIRRRRKGDSGRGQNDEDIWEDIPVEDIRPGDEVLSLDEETGAFEWHKVEKTMDMGIQEVLLLTTRGRLRIETTSNHPYLILDKKEMKKLQQHGSVFEVDQSPRIEDLEDDSFVALADKENCLVLRLEHETKRKIKQAFYKHTPDEFGPEIFALLVAEAIMASGFAVSKLLIDQEYVGYERKIRRIINEYYPELLIEFRSLGRTKSPAHQAVYEAFTKAVKKRPGSARISKDSRLQNCFTPGRTQKIRNPHGLLVDRDYHDMPFLSMPTDNGKSLTKWIKAEHIKPGMMIATKNGWDKVTSKYPRGRKQTYDLQIADTHNFVANEIVAHNTYINGSLGVGDSTPASALTVGNGDLFQVNSTGAIAAAAGITSSGGITFSGLVSCDTIDTNASGVLSCGTDGSGGGGVTTIGTIDSQVKSANGAVISGSSLVLQTADGSNPGLVSTGTQSFAGAKTFTGTVVASSFNGLSITNNGTNTLDIAAGDTFTVNNSLTLAGTDGTTFTFPGTSGTVVTLDAAQTLSNKTLTAPEFADLGFIADANGNEILVLDTVTSAVNQIQLSNAATGNGPLLAATGSDTNIPLSLDSKGTGTLNLNGTATGNILLGGGSGSTGCTVTNSTGAFACSGALSGSNFSGTASGTNTGDQTITLTNDVTGSGVGSFGTTIANNAVDGTDIALGSDTAGDLMYYDGTNWVRLPAGTGTQVLHSGATPAWASVALGTDVSGTLPIANGGTNATTIGSAGRVVYSTGTAYATTAVGTGGDCLLSSGTGTPTWGSCGSGVATIGTIDSQVKSANGAVISGSSLVLQTADGTNPGLVSTGTQTFAGAKTFSSSVTASSFSGDGASVTNVDAITLGGNSSSFYRNAGNLNAGTLLSARITGSYTGLTGTGALNAGSITTGFGAIDTGSDAIAGGNLTGSGTTGLTLSGTSAGVTFSGTGNHVISATSGTLQLGALTLAGTIAGGNQTINNLGQLDVDSLTLNGTTLSSSGDINIDATGGDVIFADADTLNIGGNAADVAYNVIGDSISGASGNVASDDDLYIEGNLEVDGTTFSDVTGNVTGNVSGGTVTPSGMTQGSVYFAGTGGVLAEDNTNLFWDNSSNELGIGTNTPDATLDVNGTVIIGNTTNGLQFDPTGGPTYFGTGRPSKTLSLNPEYPGAVLTTFYGAGNDTTNNNGFMTSDVEIAIADELRNYYQWTSTQGSLNYYTVAVRVRLPQDFGDWEAANALQIDYVTSSTSTANNRVDAYIYRENSATAVANSATSQVSGTANTWTTITYDDSALNNGGTDWDAADQVAIIYLRLGARSSNTARIGEIRLNYEGKF